MGDDIANAVEVMKWFVQFVPQALQGTERFICCLVATDKRREAGCRNGGTTGRRLLVMLGLFCGGVWPE